MSKVNIENLIEVECPILNENKMISNKLANSPKLKVQIFLKEIPARSYYEGRIREDSCTNVICKEIQRNGRCNYQLDINCMYDNLSTDKK